MTEFELCADCCSQALCQICLFKSSSLLAGIGEPGGPDAACPFQAAWERGGWKSEADSSSYSSSYSSKNPSKKFFQTLCEKWSASTVVIGKAALGEDQADGGLKFAILLPF